MQGDSQWKVYGSWGVFYDLMKLTIGRVMFGGDNWVNYYYTLDTFDWPSISCGDGAAGQRLSRHVHHAVRLPSGRQQPDATISSIRI